MNMLRDEDMRMRIPWYDTVDDGDALGDEQWKWWRCEDTEKMLHNIIITSLGFRL